MSNKNTKYWVIGGVALVGVALYVLVFRKKTLSNTGPSLNLAAPPAQPPAGTLSGPTGFGSPPASTPASKNLYLTANAISVRSSPTVSNGFLGMWFTNQVGSAQGAGSYVGSIKSTVPDSSGDKNDAGKVWTWYNVNLNPSIVVENADNYYVREDGVMIK